MVLVLETITEKDVKMYCAEKGSLKEGYNDALEYLSWVVNSKNTNNSENFNKVIDVLNERFNVCGITTKFLRSFIESKDASTRLHYVLKSSGYTTETMKQFLREQRAITSQSKDLKFENGVLVGQQDVILTRMSRFFVGRTLHKIVKQSEVDAVNQRFAEQQKEYLLQQDSKMLCNLGDPFCFIIAGNETTSRQEKAIRRMKSLGKFFTMNCKGCKHQIKIPLTPNLETDEVERKVSGIYQVIANDIEAGKYLCYDCSQRREKMLNENKKFDYSKILNDLEQLRNMVTDQRKKFTTPTLTFIMEMYRDIDYPSLEKVKWVVEKAIGDLNLNCEVVVKHENINFLFR